MLPLKLSALFFFFFNDKFIITLLLMNHNFLRVCMCVYIYIYIHIYSNCLKLSVNVTKTQTYRFCRGSTWSPKIKSIYFKHHFGSLSSFNTQHAFSKYSIPAGYRQIIYIYIYIYIRCMHI
jgi:hypothetical protein